VRIAIVDDGHIVNAVEADSVERVSVDPGQQALVWDDAIARYPIGAALTPPDPGPPPVPEQVALFQARVIMATTPRGGGTLLDAVDAAIDALPDPMEREIARQGILCANVMSRHGRVVTHLATALGLTDAALDDLFRAAAAIEV
jgi:hypothetical protein